MSATRHDSEIERLQEALDLIHKGDILYSMAGEIYDSLRPATDHDWHAARSLIDRVRILMAALKIANTSMEKSHE